MSLFSKKQVAKKISIGEDSWVQIRPLSKGEKDEISNRLSSMFSDMDEESLKKIQEAENNKEKEQELPTEMLNVLKKIQEVSYFKLSKAIKNWSEEEDITEETVKDLDDEIFDMISEEIDAMNKLSKGEEKN
jgi:hypothetical protein